MGLPKIPQNENHLQKMPVFCLLSTLICKEKLNFLLTVLRMFVKVWWVELGDTNFLLSILRLKTWFDKDPNY